MSTPLDAPNAARGAELALAALALLAIVSPWPIGCVQSRAASALCAAALLAALVSAILGACRGGIEIPAVPCWPVVGVLALGALQLVPLPAALHGIAPGSREVWHPAVPVAAAILGTGPHPVSLLPEATEAWLYETLALFGLALLAAPAASVLRRAAPVAVAVSLGALLVGVYGIVARALFGPLLFGRLVVPTVSPFGPFVSKNHFAGYVEMATLLALGLAAGLADRERASAHSLSWTGSPRAWQVAGAFAAALAMSLAVLVSLSRGGSVSLIAGTLAFVTLRVWARRHHRGRFRGYLLGAAAGLLVVVGLSVVLPRDVHERIATLGAAGGEGAASFRLGVWRDVARMTLASPLIGQGMGAFVDAFPRYKTTSGELRVGHAENDYLEMLAEAGLVGLGLCLAAAGLGLRAVIGGLARQRDRLLRGIGVGALAGIMALLVHSAFDFNLRIPSNATLFALLAALALGASADETRRLRGALSWAVAAVLAVGLLATLWPREPRSLEPARAGLATASALRDPAARRLRLARVEETLGAWVGRRPASAEAWFFLGWARAVAGTDDRTALARYAVTLDPLRPALRSELQRLETDIGAEP